MKLKEKKNQLRTEYKAKRRAMDKSLKNEYDETICRRFTELASYRYSDVILAYAHLDDEIDLTPIIKDALSKCKRVAFPKCGKEGSMTFHFIKDLSELKPGMMGISEPDLSAPQYDFEDPSPAVCFIPALLYDKDGYRLGYGKGFYDRFLLKFKGTKVGVIYSDFILNEVPRGRFDLSADVLITEKGVRTVNAN